MSVELEDIKQFFRKVIIPFHTIERDMTLPLPSHRPDNDAEHSWSLAILAVALAPEVDTSLNVGLVSIYAVAHDLVEVYAGDTSVWAERSHLESKKHREKIALQQLKSDFPHFRTLFKYIDDYEKKETNEARFVYALDKFLNLLTIVEDEGYYYRVRYKITNIMYEKQLKSHKIKAHTHPIVGKYYDVLRELFDKNPEHFYQEKNSGLVG
jgi:5'-deoxynucleotidase YfbR-like HD superfamily hydrolase